MSRACLPLSMSHDLPVMARHDPTFDWPENGPWPLPIQGFEILHMTFGAILVDIVAYGDSQPRSDQRSGNHAPSVMLRFEGEFELVELDGEVRRLDLEQQEWSALTPLFALRHDRIGSAVASADGNLELTLDSGRSLRAGPHPAYENWEVAGPGFRLIATPGGGVAVFRDAPRD